MPRHATNTLSDFLFGIAGVIVIALFITALVGAFTTPGPYLDAIPLPPPATGSRPVPTLFYPSEIDLYTTLTDRSRISRFLAHDMANVGGYRKPPTARNQSSFVAPQAYVNDLESISNNGTRGLRHEEYTAWVQERKTNPRKYRGQDANTEFTVRFHAPLVQRTSLKATFLILGSLFAFCLLGHLLTHYQAEATYPWR